MAPRPAFVAKLKTDLEHRKDKVALTPIPGQKALFWVRYKNKQVGISYYDIATGRYSFTPQYDTLDNMARYVVQTNKGIQEANSFLKALMPKRHPTIRTKIEVWRKQREITGRPVRKLKPFEKKMRALHKPQKSALQVLWHKFTHHPKHDWSTKPPKFHKARHNKPQFISVRPNLKAEPAKR